MRVPPLTKLKRGLTALAVNAMPYFPLPAEWYRRLLVADSEKRYASGRWDYQWEVAEAHRYSLIVGCADYYTPTSRRVLNVGCGDGILQRRIAYGEYVGVDMNPEAIRRARAREDARTRFHCAPAGDFTPEGRFDVVVFNESLYYIPDPLNVLAHYRRFLAEDGILVLCMFQTNLARRIWRRIEDTDLVELTAVKVSNEWGFASRVKALANRAIQPPGHTEDQVASGHQ